MAGNITKKIMIIEDDVGLREMLAMKMKLIGYIVQEADDGAKAIDSIKKDRPDLILIDILLPHKDGFEIMEEIKKSPDKKIKETPFIVMSNLSSEEDIYEAKRLGAIDYMVKARITPKDIAERVNKALVE